MLRVHLLHEARYSRNSEAFLFPLYFNRRRLTDRGISLGFYSTLTSALRECDVLCVGSRFFGPWWSQSGGEERLLDWLGWAGETAGRVLWFDLSDSTGTTHLKVLPLVNAYLKNQVLKDRRLYLKPLHGMRIYTDFYHRHFGVEDSNPVTAHLNWIPARDQLYKIQIGWNSGMVNHGQNGLRLGQIWYGRPRLPKWYPRRWSLPALGRPFPFSCRIGLSYDRNTIAFARTRIVERVRGRTDVGRLFRRAYFRELRRSAAALSPFGFGEVCYRDFEAIICGAAMVKQDMSHLETWPNLWTEDSTYYSFSWDLSDFEETLQTMLDHPRRVVEIATEAQQRYRRTLETEEGQEEFCAHFMNIVGQHGPLENVGVGTPPTDSVSS